MIDIKGEIPKKSVGRLLDALTDAIRPFTESRGLRADQIRLQREDVLIRIATKARARLDIEKGLKPIPNKFLVRFLEQASLEDGDGTLVDWWASLLCSAAQDEATQNPIYIDILGKLTSREAIFLQQAWDSGRQHGQSLATGLHHQLQEQLSGTILSECQFEKVEDFVNQLASVLVKQMAEWKASGIFCEHLTYPTGAGRGFIKGSLPASEDADVCVALGLLSRTTLDLPIPSPWIGLIRPLEARSLPALPCITASDALASDACAPPST